MASILITDAPLIQALEAESSPDFEALWDILKSDTVQGYITPNDLHALEQHLHESVGEALAEHLIAGFRAVLAVYDEANHPAIDIIVDEESIDVGADEIPIRSVSDFLCIYELECLLSASVGETENSGDTAEQISASSLFAPAADSLPVLDGDDAFEAIASNRPPNIPPAEIIPVLDAPKNGVYDTVGNNGNAELTAALEGSGSTGLTRTMQVILSGKSALAAAQQGREYGRVGRDRTLGEHHFGTADADASSGFTLHCMTPDVLLILGLMVDWGMTPTQSDATMGLPMRLGLLAGLESQQASQGLSPDGQTTAVGAAALPLPLAQEQMASQPHSGSETDTSDGLQTMAGGLADGALKDQHQLFGISDSDPSHGTGYSSAIKSLSSGTEEASQGGTASSQSVNNGAGAATENEVGGDRVSPAPASAPSSTSSSSGSELLGQELLTSDVNRSPSTLVTPQLADMMAGKLRVGRSAETTPKTQTVGPLPRSTAKSMTSTTFVSKALEAISKRYRSSTTLSPLTEAVVQNVVNQFLTTILPRNRPVTYDLNNLQGVSLTANITQTQTRSTQFAPASFSSNDFGLETLPSEAEVDLSSLGFYVYLNLYITEDTESYLEPQAAASPIPSASAEPLVISDSGVTDYSSDTAALQQSALDAGTVEYDIYSSLAVDILTVQEGSSENFSAASWLDMAEGNFDITHWLEMEDGAGYEADDAQTVFDTSGLDADDTLLQIDSVLTQQLLSVNEDQDVDDLLGNNDSLQTSGNEDWGIDVVESDIGLTVYQNLWGDFMIEGFYFLSATDLVELGTTDPLERNGLTTEPLALDDIFDTSSGFYT